MLCSLSRKPLICWYWYIKGIIFTNADLFFLLILESRSPNLLSFYNEPFILSVFILSVLFKYTCELLLVETELLRVDLFDISPQNRIHFRALSVSNLNTISVLFLSDL